MQSTIVSNTTMREDNRSTDFRGHHRYAVAQTLIRVTWLDTNGDLKTMKGARPTDVSETGMAVQITEAALLLSPMRLEYCTGELIGHGKVRSCRPFGESYICGIEFTDSLQWKAPEGVITEPIPLSAPGECEPGVESGAVSEIATSFPKELLLSNAPYGKPTTTPPLPGMHLSLDSGGDRGFIARAPIAAKICAPALVALALGFLIFGRDDATSGLSAGSATTSVVGEQGWVTEWASDAGGSRRGRQITVYRPSRNLSDYQMQFTGQIEAQAIGWVVRAADTKNYYGMKIENGEPGSVWYTRFAVVNGRERSLVRKPLPIQARADTSYAVKVEAHGPRFAVYIQGEPVELWSDDRLKTGAFGFMNETRERSRTASVGFSF